jgi:hypothetical protein
VCDVAIVGKGKSEVDIGIFVNWCTLFFAHVVLL